MKVLVTGGAGFTGVHLVRALLDRGDDVTVLDISAGSSLDTEPLKAQGAKFIIGSVADKKVLQRAVPGQKVVFHLASAFRDIHQGAPLFQEVDVEERGDYWKRQDWQAHVEWFTAPRRECTDLCLVVGCRATRNRHLRLSTITARQKWQPKPSATS